VTDLSNDDNAPYVSNNKRAKEERSLKGKKKDKEVKDKFYETMNLYVAETKAHMDKAQQFMKKSEEKYAERTEQIEKFSKIASNNVKIASMKVRLDVAFRRGDDMLIDSIMKEMEKLENEH
jgi:hypothetical protein